MNRRELLKMIALTTGTAMIGGKSLIAFSDAGQLNHPFSSKDVERLDELAETILPRTDTPGAKDAGHVEDGAMTVKRGAGTSGVLRRAALLGVAEL